MLPPPYLDVISLSPGPLKCGGFADIYQGRWNNQPVAVKKLRTFLIPNENYRKEAYKVCHPEADINIWFADRLICRSYTGKLRYGDIFDIPTSCPFLAF